MPTGEGEAVAVKATVVEAGADGTAPVPPEEAQWYDYSPTPYAQGAVEVWYCTSPTPRLTSPVA